jgi:hypothetical protein
MGQADATGRGRAREHSRVVKTDDELQIVWGEVYVPGFPDSQGDYMTAREVQKMAYRWLVQGDIKDCYDVNHDGRVYKVHPVESFIARKGDADFIEGSWVVGVYVEDASLWDRVKKGELNGFSIQARVLSETKDLDLQIPDQAEGVTLKSDGHEHRFTVLFDDKGNIVGGETDYVSGHRHAIKRGTMTEPADGHRHRFSLLDVVQRLAA